MSVEVFLDCADLACTKKRLDATAHSAATGVLHTQLFVRHWDTWSDGRRSQVFAMTLNDSGVAQGTPVNLTGGIGDVPGKPFGGREDYAFSPDGAQVAFSVTAGARAKPGRRILTFIRSPPTAAPCRKISPPTTRHGMRNPRSRPTARNSPTWRWIDPVSKPIDFTWCCSTCSRA